STSCPSHHHHLPTLPTRRSSDLQLTMFEGPDNDPDTESRPAWSPDGRSIAYLQGGPLKLIYYAVQKLAVVPTAGGAPRILTAALDRKSTRLNSSHQIISYVVFCL